MTTTNAPHIVVATITESLGPLERGARYADPLNHVLQSAHRGRVTGGGSQLDASHQVTFVDVEVELINLEDALELTRTALVQLGAPAGSVLSFVKDGALTVVSVATGEPSADSAPAADAMRRRLLSADSPSGPTLQYDPDAVRQAANTLLASYRSLFVDAFPVAPIDPSLYPASTFEWYDETARALAAVGFAALGDRRIVKDATKPEPGATPFARRLVSSDHRIRSDIFQIKRPNRDEWVRVVNLVSELSTGQFLWTTTAAQHWNTPDHVLHQYVTPDVTASELVTTHRTRLRDYQQSRPESVPIELTTLDDVLASENRCQAKTAAFRRLQAVPTVDELIRLGSERTLAGLAHAEMQRLVAEERGSQLQSSRWHVATVDLPSKGILSLAALVEFALDQGIAQVEKAGSPLNPFLIYDNGRATFFVCEEGDGDPMEIALQTIRSTAGKTMACALVLDTRMTFKDGSKSDSILVMASQRGAPDGELWAQAYRPKGFIRGFKRLSLRERVGTSKNLFAEAEAKLPV